MRTNVKLASGVSLRAHFTHYHKTREPNWNKQIIENRSHAYELGQINAHKRHNTDSNIVGHGFKDINSCKVVTVCELTLPEIDNLTGLHKLVARGYAFCSEKDQFVKYKGRKIAFQRALNTLKKSGETIQEVNFI